MIVKDLLEVFNKADPEADVFVSIFIGDIEIDVDIKDATDLGYAVFIEPKRLCITKEKENEMR